MSFAERLKEYAWQTEQFLDQYLNTTDCVGQEAVVEAMRYSALAGGKRLRPALTMEFCRVCGGDYLNALPFAVSLEMIHTYSLIHDDLPCMDNDDMRRGKPTSHKVYGEALAVLAGDALLTQAFELSSNPKYIERLPAASALKAVHILGREAGVVGMIGGQVLDMASENHELDFDALVKLQNRKTGALIRAAAQIGCTIGGASENQLIAAERYASLIGLAFQIQDDILDIEGDEQELGKATGSDMQNGKSTFPALLGLARCHEKVRELTQEAIMIVSEAFEDHTFLVQLAQELIDRKK